jgi:small subunit ribosomal protein S27Ae
MQIFVKSLENTYAVSVAENATVSDLKAAIEDKEFLPADLFKIVGEVADNETVTLLMEVEGGMRAKWRKKRMRRLRRKRRKMRMRAR